MRYVIIFLALIPMAAMGVVYLHGEGIGWCEALIGWGEHTFAYSVPHPQSRLYFLSIMASLSALWLLILAFWINPLHTFMRFDLVPFKRLIGGFAIGYAVLHVIFFAASHYFSVAYLGKLFFSYPFLAAGAGALVIFSVATWVRAWYRLLYIAVVLVIIHLLLGYRTLDMTHIVAVSLLSMGLALRLVKR
jgi:DMSO/TMAO reductase YedYZ heme-binding membrane subunit